MTATNQRCCWHHLYVLYIFLLCISNCYHYCLCNNVTFYEAPTLISANGKLDVTLRVRGATTLNGTRVSPMYNGGPIGPTLRVKPGDTLTVTLLNLQRPTTDYVRELTDYVMDPQNELDDLANVTIIYNRLDEFGNYGKPKFGFFGFNYVNVHFHGVGIPSSIELLQLPLDGNETRTFTYKIPENHPGADVRTCGSCPAGGPIERTSAR